MGKDDWFRLPCLTDERQQAFELRLRRARSSRPEYMRIQAHALAEAKAYDNALTLLDRILADHPEHLGAWIIESRADCFHKLGRYDEAVQDYVKSIARMREDPGLVSNAPLRLARLACEQERDDIYEECLGYLVEFWDSAPIFPRHELHQFGYNAILLDLLGQHEDAIPPARRALAAAAKTRSNAANHQKLGLATAGDKALVKRLERILGGNPFSPAGSGIQGLISKIKLAFTR
ncbi:MAG: tetratricopeptide repeat protein [Novosphingobium sp.]